MNDDYSVVFQVARRFLARKASIGELRQAVRVAEGRQYRARLRAVRERMRDMEERSRND